MNTRTLSPYRSRNRSCSRNGNRAVSVDQLIHHFVSPTTWTEKKSEARTPKIDIVETQFGFEVKADLPGVTNEAITVSVKDNVLTIEAQTELAEAEAQLNQAENSETAKKETPSEMATVITKERGNGKYARSLRLGSIVDESAIKASYSNGVLTLNLPKSVEPKAKQIPVTAH